MKKQCLIVLAIVATMLIGLGSLALAQSGVVAQVPGNTVVQDPAGDFLLRNCDPSHPNIPCSMPPNSPLALPGYFDIKTAKITEIGRGRVDLAISLYEPIPAEPPYGFVSYIWQFAGGCVGPNPQPGDKDAINVVWSGGTWSAYWVVITNCSPRTLENGDPVPFEFTEDGVKVRVALDDLLTATSEEGTLEWFAAVRRVPFIYTISPPPVRITHTVPVDFAPDVQAFNPTPPPVLIEPEDPATWVPR
jgi:hypothetical protein